MSERVYPLCEFRASNKVDLKLKRILGRAAFYSKMNFTFDWRSILITAIEIYLQSCLDVEVGLNICLHPSQAAQTTDRQKYHVGNLVMNKEYS